MYKLIKIYVDMLTKKDIENLTEYQKHVFVTKDDMEEVTTKPTTIQTSIDNLTKDVKDLKQEKTIINHRMKNAENWIDIASPKLGLEFKH